MKEKKLLDNEIRLLITGLSSPFSRSPSPSPSLSSQQLTYVNLRVAGSTRSGKNALVKQLKVMNMTRWTEEEKEAYKPIVFYHVCSAAQTLVSEARKRGIELLGDNEVSSSHLLHTFESFQFRLKVRRK